MSLEDIIEKLPPEYQGWAKTYGEALLSMTFDEIAIWIDHVQASNWQAAYKSLVSKMSTQQLLDSQEDVNARLLVLKKRNASYKAMMEQMVRDALTIGLHLLKGLI
jgi:hypothetical protein